MKAVKCDCSATDTYLRKVVSGPPSEWFSQCSFGLTSAAIAALVAGATASGLNVGFDTGVFGIDAFFLGDTVSGASFGPPSDVWTQGAPGAVDAGAFSANAWHVVVAHYNAGTISWLLDGVTVFSYPTLGTPPDPLEYIFGGFDANHIAGEVYYVGDVRIGTTLGGTDIFHDDFSSGSISPGWNTPVGSPVVVDDPFPTPPPPVVTVTRALKNDWVWVVTGLGTGIKTFLNRLATNVEVVFTLNAPAVWTAEVPSDNPEINIPTEGEGSGIPGDPFVSYNDRILYGFRREGGTPPYVCRYAGVITIPEDEATSDEPVTHLTAHDPWMWLNSLPVVTAGGQLLPPEGLTFTGAPGDTIAKNLLVNAMAAVIAENPSNPDFIDVSSGHFDTTHTLTITFQQGCSVGEAWTQLTDTGSMDILLTPVYDPAGRPGKLVVMNVYSEAGSARNGAVFGWDKFPHSLVGISRLLDGTQMGNVAQYYAANAAAAQQTDPASILKYGQYWISKSFAGPVSSAAVALVALADVALRRQGKRTITIDPTPERSPDPFTEYYLGDRVPVWAGRPQAGGGVSFRAPLTPGEVTSGGQWSNPQRVYAIPISLAGDQVETVTQLLLTDPNE